jgi:glycosyltransferase involved in cell wall biosynthesis
MIPRVTVLMPVYNGQAYLARTIDSLLRQTWRDFELLALDDGSTDDTWSMLERYAAADPRVRPMRNPANMGQPRTQNRGLELARGELIARNDADDVSATDRLASQVAFIDAHPEVVLLGCQVGLIDEEDRPLGEAAPYPLTDAGIRALMLAAIAFCGPAVMFRREVVMAHEVRYDPEMSLAEDFDFYSKLSRLGRLANLPQRLLDYREHQASLSHRHTLRQDGLADLISRRNLQAAGLAGPWSEADWTLMRSWDARARDLAPEQLARQWRLLGRFLGQAFTELDVPSLDRAIIRRRLISKACHALSQVESGRRPALLSARVGAAHGLAALVERGLWLLERPQ